MGELALVGFFGGNPPNGGGSKGRFVAWANQKAKYHKLSVSLCDGWMDGRTDGRMDRWMDG